MTEPITSVDGAALKRLTQAALAWLQTNHQTVNGLNVFPVPDGDTGTNMVLTMETAYKEIKDSSETSVVKVTQAIAHGALMGARGNSGVILSQIWRGLARSFDGLETFGPTEFAAALQEGSDTAYRGVAKPVEGTILTVVKDSAAAAAAAAEDSRDLIELFEQIVAAAAQSVERTPDLLPVLKQAGVVDAGGLGLKFIFEGMLRFMRGMPLDVAAQTDFKLLDLEAVDAALEAIEPGQDWEVVVDFRPQRELDLASFYNRLEMLGTSIQVGQGEDLYRVHIHLPQEKRYEPIEFAESLGTVVNVRMENLLDQMAQQAQGVRGRPLNIEPGQLLCVVVSPGPGFDAIFAGPAVAIVPGGQTMNPSTQDILQAFEDSPAAGVVILPNNKNIQLAAEQAAALSTMPVKVIATRTVPQGIAAMLSFNPDGDLDKVYETMRARVGEVDTGEVTTATRSVTLDGVAVEAGQIIGLHNGRLVCAGATPADCVLALLERMAVDQRELITIYYGNGLEEQSAAALSAEIASQFPELEVEYHHGGQPHYDYIFSAE